VVIHLLRPPDISTSLKSLLPWCGILSHWRLEKSYSFARVVFDERVVVLGLRAVVSSSWRGKGRTAA
jgi:hypothetical protein